MSQILVTLAAVFILMLLSLSLLGIGKLITGKPKMKLGSCGRPPEKKKEECEDVKGCSLCGKTDDEETA